MSSVVSLMVLAAAGCDEALLGDVAEVGEVYEIDEYAGLRVDGSDFRVGLQLADGGTSLPGDWVYTSDVELIGNGSSSTSAWACDGNCYDPDSARLELDAFTSDNVRDKDLRLCMQAADGGTSFSGQGPTRCTPWASAGGGATGTVTDSNGYDPDAYRLRLETRAWPVHSTDLEVDVRFRLRAIDSGQLGIYSQYTGWASQGGGTTSWACDSNCYDPDGFEIDMDVVETTTYDFCSSSHRCQHGFGDCDSDSDCVPGAECVMNVGNQYGYIDNGVDVCVD